MLDLTVGLEPSEAAALTEMLCESHDVFAIKEGERGETDLIQFEINTRDEQPLRQRTWRIPFAACREVSK